MNKNRYIEAGAILGLVAATAVPFAAGQAHDRAHKFDKKWSENLTQRIEAKVRAGLVKGAIGMEKGAEKMLKGADKMEAYADRLERDPAFREKEAARRSEWHDGSLTADELLEKASDFRRGADDMRKGAAEMRKAAEEMRRGKT